MKTKKPSLKKPNPSPRRLENAIRKLVGEAPRNRYKGYPSFIGPMCSYTRGQCTNGTEGCIWGQAFRACGKPLRTEGTISNILKRRKYPQEFISWASDVQSGQDFGRTWGQALKLADKAREKRKEQKEAA